MRLMLLAAGGVCIFFTAKELFPGRMNPNSLFSEAFEKLQYNEDVSFVDKFHFWLLKMIL